MKVLVERDKFLSDYEVYEHLKTAYGPKEKKKLKHGGPELETVTKEITNYLSTRPCSLQDDEKFQQLMEHLNKLDLVKVEKLQIVNSLPRSMVHLYALIEEVDARFDEDTIQSILDKIEELFPLPEPEE